MRPTRAMIAIATACLLVLGAAACSSDSGGSDTSTGTGDGSATSSDDAGTDAGGDAGSSSGSTGTPGTLTLDGEDIVLGPGRCLLEEQDAAAGGGVIELTAQAEGSNAAGDPVVVDFTRYSAESQFAGDDVSVTIGDPFSGDATDLGGTADSGTVSLDGSTVSATDFEVGEDPTASQPVSFTINC